MLFDRELDSLFNKILLENFLFETKKVMAKKLTIFDRNLDFCLFFDTYLFIVLNKNFILIEFSSLFNLLYKKH